MDITLIECTRKLEEKNKAESLKLIFQWVKTGHINLIQFNSLLELVNQK
jgi:hypothetical protein